MSSTEVQLPPPTLAPDPAGGGARRVPLAMDAEAFRRAGHALVGQVAAFLASVPGRPVTPGETPAAVRALPGGDAPLPEQGADAAELLRGADGP